MSYDISLFWNLCWSVLLKALGTAALFWNLKFLKPMVLQLRVFLVIIGKGYPFSLNDFLTSLWGDISRESWLFSESVGVGSLSLNSFTGVFGVSSMFPCNSCFASLLCNTGCLRFYRSLRRLAFALFKVSSMNYYGPPDCLPGKLISWSRSSGNTSNRVKYFVTKATPRSTMY